MWIILALFTAIFSGAGVIFQKRGAVGNNPLQVGVVNVAAILATVILVTLMKGGFAELTLMSGRCWCLTIAAGLLQTGSWIAYFWSIREANVSLFMVLDKAGIIITMLLAALILREQITVVMMLGSAAILFGTGLMADFHGSISQMLNRENSWMLWALLSASLQAASNVIIKLDTSGIDTALATSIRMLIVAVCLCMFAGAKEGSFHALRQLGGRSLLMLVLGGGIMGLSYLCMYRALVLGTASAVTAISRTNLLVSTLLARIVFKEQLSPRGIIGFCMVCFGILMFAF